MKVGLFYDYDNTLTEEFQQMPILRNFFPQLREKYDLVSPEDYWGLCEGEGISIRWMEQFLKDAKDIFKGMTNEQLKKEFASKVKMAPGIPGWFERVNRKANSLGIGVEHHVITSGALPLVEGSVVYPYLTSLVGGEFLDNGEGIYGIKSTVEPFRKIEHFRRICNGNVYGAEHILSKNAIYLGDGQSDMDLFRYLKQKSGLPIGVYERGSRDAFKKIVYLLGSPTPDNSYIDLILPRDYSEGSAIEKKVFQALENMSD